MSAIGSNALQMSLDDGLEPVTQEWARQAGSVAATQITDKIPVPSASDIAVSAVQDALQLLRTSYPDLHRRLVQESAQSTAPNVAQAINPRMEAAADSAAQWGVDVAASCAPAIATELAESVGGNIDVPAVGRSTAQWGAGEAAAALPGMAKGLADIVAAKIDSPALSSTAAQRGFDEASSRLPGITSTVASITSPKDAVSTASDLIDAAGEEARELPSRLSSLVEQGHDLLQGSAHKVTDDVTSLGPESAVSSTITSEVTTPLTSGGPEADPLGELSSWITEKAQRLSALALRYPGATAAIAFGLGLGAYGYWRYCSDRSKSEERLTSLEGRVGQLEYQDQQAHAASLRSLEDFGGTGSYGRSWRGQAYRPPNRSRRLHDPTPSAQSMSKQLSGPDQRPPGTGRHGLAQKRAPPDAVQEDELTSDIEEEPVTADEDA